MIQGLTYISEFLNPLIELRLIETIDQAPWSNHLQRRIQHYGSRSDHENQLTGLPMQVSRLPTWALSLAESIVDHGGLGEFPNQMIVNEFEPGQGMESHEDGEPCMGNAIASLTLGSGCSMIFNKVTGTESRSVYLEPRSIVILSGEARCSWEHSVSRQTFDDVNGERIPRSRRISLTFRTVNVGSLQL
ncbi:MAG: alpha-ketoglutarate-dependent dioxygenase AlkB [Planctomycetaceae bacterium]|nr:alpha-ketoglutarate-dependent dioxygenase AlkB [Planctomycetaceae bacterium]